MNPAFAVVRVRLSRCEVRRLRRLGRGSERAGLRYLLGRAAVAARAREALARLNPQPERAR